MCALTQLYPEEAPRRPGGVEWSWGAGGLRLELDAVDFCRTLSGRGPAEGLLAVEVPF